jgi:hypothetical protein
VSLRRLASAGPAAASVLVLLLSQPFHAPAPGAPAERSPAFTTAAVDPAGASSPNAAHDADRCPQCRAFAKTRLGLRTPAAIAPAADRPLLSLQGPPPAPARAAAELRRTRPRAPPIA